MKASTLFAMAAMMGTAYDYPGSGRDTNPLRPEDIDVKPKKPVVQRGTRKFVIEGVEIYAINEKNAIKKYNKQKNK